MTDVPTRDTAELEKIEIGAGAGAGQTAKATKKLAMAPFSRTSHFPHGVQYVTDKALMASYTTTASFSEFDLI